MGTMFGPSLKSVFRSRWMALAWSGMIIWMAVDFIGTGDPSGGAGNSAQPTHDATGSTVTKQDIETLRSFAEGR
jgi:hypothetical protein